MGHLHCLLDFRLFNDNLAFFGVTQENNVKSPHNATDFRAEYHMNTSPKIQLHYRKW